MASETLPSKPVKLKPATPDKRSNTAQHGKVHEAADETEQLIVAIIGTGLKAPVAFLYNLANGFHNAPSYILHDETVRRRGTIRGIRSGLRVAGKGLAFNLFDGVTGLVSQPVREAAKGGAEGFGPGVKGFGKGVGKGAGGLVFKLAAAALGVPAYTLKGVEKQIEKRFDHELKAKILEVRLRQGLAAYGKATAEEKEEILKRWSEFGGGKID